MCPNDLATGICRKSGKATAIAILIASLGSTTACKPPFGIGAGTANVLPGSSWNSINNLPDWAGAWSLSRESFGQTVADAFGCGDDRVPLTANYRSIRASGRAEGVCEIGLRFKQTANLTKCIPPGVPGVLTHPFAHEYLFTPGRVTMLFEDNEIRRIYTDGRAHLDPVDLYDSFFGDSIGHWEGQTLVVDTVGMLPEAEFFILNGIHVTKQTHVVERIFRKDTDTMQIDTVVTDPEVFTAPYTYSLTFKPATSGMVESVCLRNNRDDDQSLDLTPPPPQA